ncbi:MAG: hypothetical protein ACXVA9_11520 [Bdellovibrionales bacterium]
MKNENDDRFMAQFNNRFALEPAPKWATERKFEMPWLEIGWAFAAALMLAVYWTELRFGFFSLHAVVDQFIARVPVKLLFAGLATVAVAAGWLAPKIAREL